MKDKICMIGLGYVGLPLALAVAFAEKYSVIGYDINQSRIDELEGGKDRTLEVKEEQLLSVNANLTYTFNIEAAAGCNIYIVTVPTPIDNVNRPDLTPLKLTRLRLLLL